MNQASTNKLLHAEELARMAGVHKSTILLAIRRGELHASRTVGRSARISPEDAKAFLLDRGKEVPPELEEQTSRVTLVVLTENPDVLGMVRQALPGGAVVRGSSNLYGSLIAVGARAPEVIVVDLDLMFLNPALLIRALRNSPTLCATHIVGVGLRDDLFGAARTAGANDVIIKLDQRTLSDLMHRLAGVQAQQRE